MEKQDALNILASRKLVKVPGKYTAKVTSVTRYSRTYERGPSQIAIVNFNVMTAFHQEKAITLYKQGLYQEAVNHTLSSSIREGDFLPVKGETVNIMVSEVSTRNGVTGLFVTAISPIPAETPDSFNTALLEEEDTFTGTSILVEEEEIEPVAEKAPLKPF